MQKLVKGLKYIVQVFEVSLIKRVRELIRDDSLHQDVDPEGVEAGIDERLCTRC
jgi:hypothetical protein